MTIKILGSGCPKCQQLEENAKKAVEELELKDVKVEHIYDVEKIIEMGIMVTPAMAIDEKILSAGKIPSVEEIKEIIKQNL
jgi:small redox-active disulfide protein 2